MNKLLFLFFIVFLASCGRNFNMRVCSGDGIAYTETWIQCDSFQMVTNTEAYIWVNGTKMKIIGNRGIKPESN